mmetsp:Transcript_15696/g.45211  ORF Transcript_15696/g.45211 Transcript_15696/m.45211 type:complete len:146 (-) Transcript_15696:72-509(-)
MSFGLEEGLAPSTDMIDELHMCAAEWEKATVQPDNGIGTCVRLVCALSRLNILLRATFDCCLRCSLQPRSRRDSESETDDEHAAISCPSSKEPARKRRRTESVQEMVSLLRELKFTAQELHAKKANAWFAVALQRVDKTSKTKKV